MKHTTALALLLMCAAGAMAQNTTTQKPDVVTTLTGPSELQVGRSARWAMSLKNEGWAVAAQTRTTIVLPPGTDLDIRISLTSPNGYRAVPVNCSYVVLTRTLTCLANNIAVGETRNFNIDLQGPVMPSNLTITANTAIAAGEPDSNLANNSASTNTLVANFTPAITFPTTNARMWMCPGKRELLECSSIPNWALPLDANGQMIVAGAVRLAATAPPGSGTFTMNQYGTWGQLVYSWNLTPYNSRCYQGPVTSYVTGDPYPYEGRVCH